MKAIVITRDRVSCTRRCVAELRAAGCDVVVADHGSTYPPMLRWLLDAQHAGVPVWRRGDAGPQDLWHDRAQLAAITGGDPFIVTDPDVVPAPGCPADWPARLAALLGEHPGYIKAGLGLRIDNLPASFARAQEVRDFEDRYWQKPISDGVYEAYIDTTLAVYRDTRPFDYGPALRSGPPYVAEHLPWYPEAPEPTPETVYYREHALPDITHW